MEYRPGEGWTGRSKLLIRLEPRSKTMRCSRCGRKSRSVHDTTMRRIRDLPILDWDVVLLVPRRRLWCSHCGGPHLEALDWLSPHRRVTRRLEEAIGRLSRMMPLKQVAAFYGVGWHTVKAIDKALLQQEVLEPDWRGIEYLGMDEFALHKGHRYATVIVEPLRRQVLWVGEGRSREAIRPFFEGLDEAARRRIKAVVMDMNTAFDLEVQAYCPNAEVVYDLFHVVAKYGREVIDRVRVDEANRLCQDKRARKVIKSARWLLLRNRENLKTAEQTIRLDELLAANRALMTVYVLKEDLKCLWRYRHAGYAKRLWEGWYQRAMESGITPLMQFARRLKPYLQGILAHCRHPLHTSVLEGINNRIKVIKRMAYGFRDTEYFFLKIRAAFPGDLR
ncbi:MAG TPA: ISL3 family transposase [Gammaproteobacteria bacterium]|nr:ISL3 family transposase [Gammaproteobacteria bacterium]